ncbi:hypothetical protein IWQ57_001126 [Coemansia nantahalensis]|uniref:Uncharacterized protein n=1 Tax=Coemansia nantahalensis TaxID=2789366 RepID=A0ACC1K5G3_9FUNG|nr:hypothetical protein IWQ57_001126 [Coemansia nantahalensis]
MSTYEPPPLDSEGPLGGRRARGGRTGRGAPLVNPFGPADNHPAAGDGDSRRQSVIAFVSGIDTAIDDDWVMRILRACGDVDSWNRVRGADGARQRFGFCAFSTIDGAACAVRVLSGADGDSLTLPGPEPAAKRQPLRVSVESSVRDAIDACTDDRSAIEAAARTSVAEIVRELAAAVACEGAPPAAADDAEGEEPAVSLEEEDAYERERAESRRRKHLVLAAEERERKIARDQADRDERIARNAARDLARVESAQRERDACAAALARWDDAREEQLAAHEYYRNRQRWWRSRKAARARELDADAADRGAQQAEEAAAPTAGGSAAAKALIDEIPAERAALFGWPVKWQHVDDALLGAKIEPAVRRRLREYLGDDDEDGSVAELTEFVVAHIRARKPPAPLADDLQMVLVDDAPVFVARIWRVVVFETESLARAAAAA